MKILAKSAFSSFCSIGWNFFKKQHCYLPKLLRVFFPDTFVQIEYSRSFSCLKLTYALNLSHYLKSWLYACFLVTKRLRILWRKQYSSGSSVLALKRTQDDALSKYELKSTFFTVLIWINATTLMHKSNLSTNNFVNNHFRQKYQKQYILRGFRRF